MYPQYVSLWTCFMKKIGNSCKTVQYGTNNVENRVTWFLRQAFNILLQNFIWICVNTVCEFVVNLGEIWSGIPEKRDIEKSTEILNMQQRF